MTAPSARLGPYTLIRELGAGGMGEVHLAWDPRLGREVAIKILPDAHVQDRERRSRLLREARAAAALNHPNIATVYDVGEADGRDYVALERIEGQNLHELLRSRRLSIDEILNLALPLADALAYAHERGVIHRDVKTANVMLTAQGAPKLLDFGLAKFDEGAGRGGAPELTQSGAILGTPGSMSPEQVQGRPVDARSDVFSFGSLLYELVTARPAFQGETVMDVMTSVLRDEPAPLATVRADVPQGLDRIVGRALRKDPAERYPSMRDLIVDLDRLRAAGGEGRVARAPRAGKRAALLAGAAVLALLVGVTWLVLARTEEAPGVEGSYVGARIGVIGFDNVSDPDDSKHLVRMLVPLLTTDLAESGGLEVLSTARVREAMRQVLGPDAVFDASFASEVARAAGAEVMLIGDVTEGRGGLQVVGEIVEVATGRTLGSARARSDAPDELFQVATVLCAGVRGQLGLRDAAGAGAPFDAAASLTSSAAAWNQFVAGRLALHEADYGAARQHFEGALREDETFALAAFYLSVAIDWSGATDRSELRALERGLPYLARLPERWRATYEAALAWAREDWDGAYVQLNRLAERPDVLPDALNLLGELHEHDARYWNPARAREVFERALEIDPTFDVVVFHLVDTLLLQGDDAALGKLIDSLRARDPGSGRALVSEAMSHVWHRRWKEAVPLVAEIVERHHFMDWWFAGITALGEGRVEEAEAKFGDGVERAAGFRRTWAYQARGLARLTAGRMTEAREDLEAALASIETRELGDVVRAGVTFAVDEGRLLELVGDPEGAIAVVRRGVELVPHEARGHFWLVHLLRKHGTPEETDRALAAFAAVRQESHNVSFPFWTDMIEAERALADSDHARVHAALAHAASHPREARDLTIEHWLAGRLAESEGDPRRAADAYAEVVTTYSWYVQSHAQLVIEARVRRAFLLQDLGDAEFDRGVLEDLVKAWGHTGLPVVEEAARRLAR